MFFWLQPSLEELLASPRTNGTALLLYGPPGLGLDALALSFAAALLCERSGGKKPACGQCPACGWWSQGAHPDFRRVQPAALADEGAADGAEPAGPRAGAKPSEVIRIDQIRALETFLSVGTHRQGRRIVQIDPADRLNTESANALLKTLEEPLPDTVFLLVTDRVQGLLPTIRSRCIRKPVVPPRFSDAVQWLSAEAALPHDEAERWLRASHGRPLEALERAKAASDATHRIALEALVALPNTGWSRASEQLAPLGLVAWVPVLADWVDDLVRACFSLPAGVFPQHQGRLADLARRCDPVKVTGFQQWLAREHAGLRHPVNPRQASERIVMAYCDCLQ
jgi:DNA polymerase-3 subunit delta'